MTQHEAINQICYGLGAIQKERVRQVCRHGFMPDRDDQYINGELLLYARYWLTQPHEDDTRADIINDLRQYQKGGWADEWFKYDEKTPEERRARAGALIAADIDRLNRLA